MNKPQGIGIYAWETEEGGIYQVYAHACNHTQAENLPHRIYLTAFTDSDLAARDAAIRNDALEKAASLVEVNELDGSEMAARNIRALKTGVKE